MNQMLSPAAQVIIAIIPIVGICFAASIIFFALLWKHRENVMRIERNTFEPLHINLKSFSLFLGLVLIGVGFALSVMFLFKPISWGLLGGLLPFAIGIMLLVYYKISK